MTDVCEEVTLGFVGGFGHFLGRFQLPPVLQGFQIQLVCSFAALDQQASLKIQLNERQRMRRLPIQISARMPGTNQRQQVQVEKQQLRREINQPPR